MARLVRNMVLGSAAVLDAAVSGRRLFMEQSPKETLPTDTKKNVVNKAEGEEIDINKPQKGAEIDIHNKPQKGAEIKGTDSLWDLLIKRDPHLKMMLTDRGLFQKLPKYMPLIVYENILTIEKLVLNYIRWEKKTRGKFDADKNDVKDAFELMRLLEETVVEFAKRITLNEARYIQDVWGEKGQQLLQLFVTVRFALPNNYMNAGKVELSTQCAQDFLVDEWFVDLVPKNTDPEVLAQEFVGWLIGFSEMKWNRNALKKIAQKKFEKAQETTEGLVGYAQDIKKNNRFRKLFQLNVNKFDLNIALCVAAKEGDINFANRILSYEVNGQKQVDVNALTPYDAYTNRKATPLHFAARHFQTDMVEYLLNRPDVDFNIVDGWGMTPLYCMARSGMKEPVNRMLNMGVDVTKGTESPLRAAIQRHSTSKNCKHSTEIVKLILEHEVDGVKQVDVNASFFHKGKNEMTPLNFALYRLFFSADDTIIKYLLNRSDVALNIKDFMGNTPLDIAKKYGYNEIVGMISKKLSDL